MTTKQGYVPTTFSDAGTGEVFEGGQTHRFEVGAHANYEAAGLIGQAPASRPAAKKAPTKKVAPRKPRATTPAPAPAPAPVSTAPPADDADAK